MGPAATPEQFREYADTLDIETDVTTGADGRPELDAADGEEVAAVFAGVEAAIGDDGLSLGSGTAFITTRRVVWLPAGGASTSGPAPGGLALRYRQVVMHAIASGGSFPGPCVYLQLDEGPEAPGGGALGGGLAVIGVGLGPGGGGGAEEGDEDEDEGEEGEEEGLGSELRLVPADAAEVEAIFKAMCECSALNPDSDAEDDGQGELFFDEAEALAGLPPDQRDAAMAARAAGALGVRDEVDERMEEDPDRFADDDGDYEDEGEGEEGEVAGEPAAAAAAGGRGGGGANGSAA